MIAYPEIVWQNIEKLLETNRLFVKQFKIKLVGRLWQRKRVQCVIDFRKLCFYANLAYTSHNWRLIWDFTEVLSNFRLNNYPISRINKVAEMSNSSLSKHFIVFIKLIFFLSCRQIRLRCRGLGRIYKGLAQSGSWGCFDGEWAYLF